MTHLLVAPQHAAAEKLGRRWVGIDLSPVAYSLVQERLAREVPVGSEESPRLTGWNVTHGQDIPRRTDIDAPKNYRQHKHVLYGQQEGRCNGCRMDFPFKIFEVDHIIPQRWRDGPSRESSTALRALQST